jgi:hypothetical protein
VGIPLVPILNGAISVAGVAVGAPVAPWWQWRWLAGTPGIKVIDIAVDESVLLVKRQGFAIVVIQSGSRASYFLS